MSDGTFDPLLLSRARLGIVATLMTRGEATFGDLKSVLGLTQGNLGIHLQKLAAADYVVITKEFVDRRPRTTARLSARGKRAFVAHVTALEQIVREAEGDKS